MRVSNEQIVSALFSTGTNKAAAAAVGLSERAFYDRVRSSECQALIAQTKTAILESATSRAESRLSDAVRIMGEIMADPENGAQTRLNAAEALIRQTLKLIEVVDVTRRLDEVEQAMKEWEK